MRMKMKMGVVWAVVWGGVLMGQVTSIPPASGTGGGGGSLPSQTLYPSSLLTTDGTTAAWTYITKIPSSGSQSLGAANAISADRSYVTISPTSTFTFSATPTIADGSDGQVVVISNVHASNTATIPGESLVSGSNVCSTVNLAPGQSTKLVFSTSLSCWSVMGLRQQFLFGSVTGNQLAAATTSYVGFVSANYVATEGYRELIIPAAGVLRNFRMSFGIAQPATGDLVCTVRKNAADTSITITLANADGTSALKSDTTNTATVVAGDRVTIKCVNNASGSSATTYGTLITLEY